MATADRPPDDTGQHPSHIRIGSIEHLDNRGGFFGISHQAGPAHDSTAGATQEASRPSSSEAERRKRAKGSSNVDGSSQDETPLTEEEIRTLARIYHYPQAALQVLTRAGFAAERLPAWSDSLGFWRQISALLAHGILVQGRLSVLTEAVADYPGNAVLRAGLQNT